jgi:SAM-dependent methyltransferase
MTAICYPLYESFADLWPLLAPLDSYAEEMATWIDLIVARIGRKRSLHLLDLGSGGGHHLYHLVSGWKGQTQCVAVDLCEPMLQRVRTLLPGARTVQADMTTLRLDQRFDVVTVHDSFCYLTELAQVKALFATVARHLRPGGVALLKVDALAGEFEGPYRYLTTYEDASREVTLTHYEWDPDPGDSWLEVVYLFLERSQNTVTTREERHRLGLFSRRQILAAAKAAQLAGTWVDLERWDDERPNPLLCLTRHGAGNHNRS